MLKVNCFDYSFIDSFYLSRVTRPPGGKSTIFSSSSSVDSDGGSAETSPPPRRTVNYKMASNFELGDEQPAAAPQANRRRSKPSSKLVVEYVVESGAYVCRISE